MSEITLLNIDCMEFMASCKDKEFDLAIVDPPYNIVSQQKRGIGSRIDASGKMNNWNNIKPSPEYFKELFRVSKFQIIFGANNFILPETEYFIIWDKAQTVDNFASAEYAWTNIKMPAKIFHYSIHQHNANKGIKIHPTMKPIALYKWLLKNYANPGDKILDTHGGSMSSAIACHEMGFDLTLCEIDKDYYDAGVKRYKKEIAQEDLFEYDGTDFKIKDEIKQTDLFNE
jgi:site-specific DNA-methyltransferase (adenine-specific)